MCGRYVTAKTVQAIEKRFNVKAEYPDIFSVSFNLSVGHLGPVITDAQPSLLQSFQFGFTPHWAKKPMYVFNARSEGDHNKENNPSYTGAKGILQKKMFRQEIRSQRCLVIADAFIEGSKEKRLSEPYVIYPKDKEMTPFAMAGIWSSWTNKETGEIVNSFAVITTTANDLLQRVGHHRSPVVLSKEDEGIWLDRDVDMGTVTSLLKPFDANEFNAYPISTDIKSPKNNYRELLKPVGERIYKEYDYVLFEELELFGMGESPARNRRKEEDKREGDQLTLF